MPNTTEPRLTAFKARPGRSTACTAPKPSTASTGPLVAVGDVRPGRSPGVQRPTNNFSANDSKWAKIEWLRKHSVVRRQRTCMTRAHGDTVTVKRSDNGMAFGGLMQCGSRLCPVCGPKIAASDRVQITAAIKSWQEGMGGKVLFGTFTLRHTRGQKFDVLARGISAGWKAVTGERSWGKERQLHGIKHTIRVFEEKFNPLTGWHLHIHYLLFVAADNNVNADHCLKGMFKRWKRSALDLGLGRPSWIGQDLHEVTDFALTALGRYLSKQSDGTEEKAFDTAQKLGFELTLRDGKFTADSLTPGELLSLAVAGVDPWAASLWAEYELGMHKRRAIAFSLGLRAELGLDEPLTDKQIAETAAKMEGATEYSMRASSYRKISELHLRRELLNVSYRSADEAILWLHERGIYAWKEHHLDTHKRVAFDEGPRPFTAQHISNIDLTKLPF